MCRLIVESLLGLRLEAGRLHFAPVLPGEWAGFRMSYRYRDTLYRIELQQVNAGAVGSTTLDGVAQPDDCVPLRDDGVEHQLRVRQARAS